MGFRVSRRHRLHGLRLIQRPLRLRPQRRSQRVLLPGRNPHEEGDRQVLLSSHRCLFCRPPLQHGAALLLGRGGGESDQTGEGEDADYSAPQRGRLVRCRGAQQRQASRPPLSRRLQRALRHRRPHLRDRPELGAHDGRLHRGLHFGVALGPGPDRRSPLRHRRHRPPENVHAGILRGFAGSPRQGHANSRRGGGQRPHRRGLQLGGKDRSTLRGEPSVAAAALLLAWADSRRRVRRLPVSPLRVLRAGAMVRGLPRRARALRLLQDDPRIHGPHGLRQRSRRDAGPRPRLHQRRGSHPLRVPPPRPPHRDRAGRPRRRDISQRSPARRHRAQARRLRVPLPTGFPRPSRSYAAGSRRQVACYSGPQRLRQIVDPLSSSPLLRRHLRPRPHRRDRHKKI